MNAEILVSYVITERLLDENGEIVEKHIRTFVEGTQSQAEQFVEDCKTLKPNGIFRWKRDEEVVYV